ncbi:hypothetical protein ITX31_05925 [Arthrobacter gandavensis]|uniref:hypothetical protein n=1 Tax=Arthrobacter gandavensis TaxID=169960 RepID=UPI00189072D8|nr:hypothetical protein [Arthrobacter gandavensis]MBF4993645.1 hypothetical protein [Arthrobacter gandavensis]
MAQVWIWNTFGTQMLRADAIIRIESSVSGTEAQVSVTTTAGQALVWAKNVTREEGENFDYEVATGVAQGMAVQVAQTLAVQETSNAPVKVLNFMAEEEAQAS